MQFNDAQVDINVVKVFLESSFNHYLENCCGWFCHGLMDNYFHPFPLAANWSLILGTELNCQQPLTSQNVSSEAQLCFRQVMFRSHDIKVFVFLIILIYQICDIMVSISTWDRVHFWMYLLNHNSLSSQNWQTDRYKQGQ